MTINSSVKTILCYGDSNTWGANPKDDVRYPRDVRWPYILQNLLGSEYEIISEGLPGRTFVAHDPVNPQRTGITHLQAIIESHDPIDLIIVMLGTNDIKTTYGLVSKDIANHLEQTIKLVQEKDMGLLKRPQVLVICPPSPVEPENNPIDPRIARYPEFFSVLPKLYEEVAKKYKCSFINAGDYISSSKIDGYHLDSDAHLKLAEVISEKIMKMEL